MSVAAGEWLRSALVPNDRGCSEKQYCRVFRPAHHDDRCVTAPHRKPKGGPPMPAGALEQRGPLDHAHRWFATSAVGSAAVNNSRSRG
jgi:hypothetical protein